jgi:hypothetical protein
MLARKIILRLGSDGKIPADIQGKAIALDVVRGTRHCDLHSDRFNTRKVRIGLESAPTRPVDAPRAIRQTSDQAAMGGTLVNGRRFALLASSFSRCACQISAHRITLRDCYR